MAGFEPAISSSPSLRDARLRYILSKGRRGRIRTADLVLPKHAGFQATPRTETKKRPAGVEPALPPWQGSRLPLHHGRVESLVELSKIRAPGGTRTHVAADQPSVGARGAGFSPLDDQCLQTVGSEGLEPSPTWLRARHAAANTLIPCSCFTSRCSCAHNWRGGNRTLDLVLIRDLLSTTELRAAAIAGQSQLSGAEGSRTLTYPLKRRKRCRYATTPSVEWAYAFKWRGHVISPGSVVRGGVEPGHRGTQWSRRRIRSLCFRYNTGQSGRSESNRLSRAPKAREAPSLFNPMFVLL